MPDSGSHRHTAPRPPHHRPPPLLVIAATGLVVVMGLAIALVIVRLRGGDASADDKAAVIAPAPAEPEPPRAPANDRVAAAQERREPDHVSAPPPAPAAPPSEAPPADVPEWERKPLRTSQPFPEEARYDPPMAPIKIPPEMLIPIAAPDAAAPR